jgi:cobaltochelatase CobN
MIWSQLMNDSRVTSVIRADGESINVVRKRGQLFVCSLGCCCGRTDKGFDPVPHDLYHREWDQRRLRNKVHLTQSGCLGPCALANVVLLQFDGQPIWFHSINDETLIRALYDYIDALLAADAFVLPAARLDVLAFNGFAWGASLHGDQAYLPLDSVG